MGGALISDTVPGSPRVSSPWLGTGAWAAHWPRTGTWPSDPKKPTAAPCGSGALALVPIYAARGEGTAAGARQDLRTRQGKGCGRSATTGNRGLSEGRGRKRSAGCADHLGLRPAYGVDSSFASPVKPEPLAAARR